ncbi:MAG: response regulator [Ignavibacteriaceae bacterium]|nr:response regulator [Ignavibacteriaceae bacterium]
MELDKKGTVSILIVEDEKIVAMDIAVSLKSVGYEVLGIVASGKDAIELVNQSPPDLILMDIKIKGSIDGIETAEIIQSQHDIPIVYLTAFADENTLSRARITAPYGYIIKPFDKKTAHTIIEIALYKNSMEKTIKENERWLSKILQYSGDAMIATDAHGKIKLMNKIAETETGWNTDEVTGRDINEILKLSDENTKEQINAPIIRLFSEDHEQDISKTAILIDKEMKEKLIAGTASWIKDDKNNTTGIVIVFRDITKQRNVEKERERLFKKVSLAQERLKVVSKRLLEVQESERRHIARELHDEIGQILTAIKINIQTAFKLAGSEKIESHLNEGVELIEEALFQVRKLSIDLRPSMLDDLGLIPALRWYVDRQSVRAGITAKVSVDETIMRLPNEIEITCFRVAQEALTNIIKHSQATHVEIMLYYEEGDLHLKIIDDGVGFNFFAAVQRSLKGESMGILGMQERVELIGGKIKINSKAGNGTTVHTIFPGEVINLK